MIAQALIGPGPTQRRRRAAYAAALGAGRVRDLTPDAALAGGAVVDLDDPDALPAAERARLLASDAWIVAGAPFAAAPAPRTLAAWPDLLCGPVAAMRADPQALGPRTMAKAIVVTETPGLGPAAWRALLALTALGGRLARLAARREPRGAGFQAVYGVGRFLDGSVAYLEACAGCPPGAGLDVYEIIGRGELREFDSRRSINRVIRGGTASPLPSSRPDAYAQFAAQICRGERPRPPDDLAPTLRDAAQAFAVLPKACRSRTAVTL